MIEFVKLNSPIPSGGVDYYRLEIERSLNRSIECRNNYQKYSNNKECRTSAVDYLPIKLDIENVSRCNLRCDFCAVSTWPKQRRASDLSVESFSKLLQQQVGLVEIKLNGLGEALMQGTDFFRMVTIARSVPIWVRVTTNGTLLHLKDNYKKLADSDVNEIDVSIDSCVPSIYEKIRIGAKFDRVSKNLKLLNGLFDDRGLTRTKMWTLVQRDNFDHLKDITTFAADHGFKHHVFSVGMHGWGDPELERRNDVISREFQMTTERALSIQEYGESIGVRVAFWGVNTKFTERNLCPWPFERAVVSSDQRVVPCCMIGNPDAAEIGQNIRSDAFDFSSVWLGAEYKKFRDAHLAGYDSLPEYCKSCYQRNKT